SRLTPTYIKSLPKNDGWGDPYDYVDQSNHQVYGIRSLGKDNAQSNSGTYKAGTQTKQFDCDIVYSMGSFVQWPEGMQTQ
ncbi:MAG TPA: type II secretion system protein GspG, partial [Thermoanaerobaculia bacterium]